MELAAVLSTLLHPGHTSQLCWGQSCAVYADQKEDMIVGIALPMRIAGLWKVPYNILNDHSGKDSGILTSGHFIAFL